MSAAEKLSSRLYALPIVESRADHPAPRRRPMYRAIFGERTSRSDSFNETGPPLIAGCQYRYSAGLLWASTSAPRPALIVRVVRTEADLDPHRRTAERRECQAGCTPRARRRGWARTPSADQQVRPTRRILARHSLPGGTGRPSRPGSPRTGHAAAMGAGDMVAGAPRGSRSQRWFHYASRGKTQASHDKSQAKR